MTRPDLLDALARPVCAVCDHAATAGRRYLQGVLADGINDVPLRATWRRGGALCREHWRVWRSLETPALPTAILLHDLLGAQLDAPPAQPACPACAVAADAERRALTALARVSPSLLATAFADGAPGFVCLPHLRAQPPGPVRDAFTARLRTLREELAEAIRLSDHRFAREPKGTTADAWLRAIRAFGGDV